uniref:Disease resistance R13L4/SHOC-2-like LRR domain-containing protein n=1 Tax=Lotharella globosa TaxID=91324 RepID=A0A7S3ZGM3_9EUKA
METNAVTQYRSDRRTLVDNILEVKNFTRDITILVNEYEDSWVEDAKELADALSPLTRTKLDSEYLSQLSLLNLSGKDLTMSAIPAGMSLLKGLRVLRLESNMLESLPDEFGELRLRTLDLSENKFTRLPASVTKMSSLKGLYVERNELKALPNEISKLINLEVLKMRMNKVKALPEGITSLASLRVLDLSDNKISNVPKSIRKLKGADTLWTILVAISI